MEKVRCSCKHMRDVHDFNGCTWEDPDGSNKCPCRKTYMDLSPRK
jgi:hypothetical protein